MRKILLTAALALSACGTGDVAYDENAPDEVATREDGLIVINPCMPHKSRVADATMTIGPNNSQVTRSSPNATYPAGLFDLCRKYVVDLTVSADASGNPIDLAAGALGFNNTSNAIDPNFPFPGFVSTQAISKTHCESYSTSVTFYKMVNGAFEPYSSASFKGQWNGSMCIPKDVSQNKYAPEFGTIIPPASGSAQYRFAVSASVDGALTRVGVRAKHSNP